jgi:hypothetical protein
MGLRVSGILENYIRFADGFAAPIKPVIKTTLAEVDWWITKDFMGPDRLKLHIDHGESQDDVEPFYYLRRHPVLCGLMIFRFSLTMNELGLSNSNQWVRRLPLPTSTTRSVRNCPSSLNRSIWKL